MVRKYVLNFRVTCSLWLSDMNTSLYHIVWCWTEISNFDSDTKSDSSKYARLIIYDGKDSTSPIIGGKLCGSIIPTTIVSSSNELYIRFQSTVKGDNAGFKLLVEEKGM